MTTTITRSTDAAAITPTLVLDEWESEDEPGTIIHPRLNGGSPDVTLREAHTRTGTMRLMFWDHATANTAREFHRAAAVFSTTSDLPWVPAHYVPAGSIRLAQSRENRKRWVLTIPFQEVAP